MNPVRPKPGYEPVKLLAGLTVIFALFQWTAASLKSFRGEYGFIVCIIIVAATLAAQRMFFDRDLFAAIRSVGLTFPDHRGVAVATLISAVLLLTVPAFSYFTNTTYSFYPNWPWLAVGMFFQGGVAEEALFRGYLYGYFRKRYPFWQAAAYSSIPFVIVHLLIFFTMDWTVALASVLLSVGMSFPLAKLFDLGGRTVWPPAILHFAAQAGPKLVVYDAADAMQFPLIWMAVALVVPFIVFAFRDNPAVADPEGF